MEDKEIIALFMERDEGAIVQTRLKYGSYCSTIARNITDCPQDAEECVSDTLLRAWNSIPPQKPLSLKAYLGKLTRNLALDLQKQKQAQSRGGGAVALALEELEECLPSGQSVEQQLDARELGRAISAFAHGLKPQERLLFLRRYFYMDSLADAAVHAGCKPKNAAVLLHRIRKQLKEFLRKEGFV